MLLSFKKTKKKDQKKKKRERKIIAIDNNYNEWFSLDLDLQFFNVQDKNKTKGLKYILQIVLYFEKFRMFFVFLRIGQIKVSYYIEKSKTCEFSSVHFSILSKLDERGKCLENIMQFSR